MTVARDAPQLVTVAIPVHNGAVHIAQQLDALARQTYGGPWELLVVDNRCTDRTISIVRGFRQRLPELRIEAAHRVVSLNHARNAAAACARGELLAFCDADDVATPHWLAALVRGARDADLVTGRTEPLSGRGAAGQADADVRPERVWLEPMHGFMPHASGGNCAAWTEVARTIRWDESFAFGSSDVEFSWRIQLAGGRIAIAPGAVMRVRARERLPAVMRQSYAYGHSDAQLYRKFRALGMANPSATKQMPSWRWLVQHPPPLRAQRDEREQWLRIVARKSGRALGSLRYRVVVS